MLQKKITNVLFDLDGTLFDSIPVILESFQASFLELNEQYPGDEIIKTFLGSDLENTFGAFLKPEKISLAIETYRKIYAVNQEKGIPLFTDVLEILKYLQQKKYNLGIVTTKLRKYSELLLEVAKIESFFEIVIGAEDVIKRKPDAEPLLKAVELMQTTLNETIYVGDALIDMQASANAEMVFIAVTTGTTSAEKFSNHGQKIILANLQELDQIL